jgi:hypothetical protein
MLVILSGNHVQAIASALRGICEIDAAQKKAPRKLWSQRHANDAIG